MSTLSAFLLAIVIFLVAYHVYAHRSRLHVGQQAPLFSLLDQDGKETALTNFIGKKIVIYFFPKSDTPGCTQQACGIRDIYEDYRKHDIVVFGISYDSPETLKKFKDKYHVPFTFLSDKNKKVALDYGAYKSSINALFPERITFLINEKGTILKILNNVNVSTHAQDIIKYFGDNKTNNEPNTQ